VGEGGAPGIQPIPKMELASTRKTKDRVPSTAVDVSDVVRSLAPRSRAAQDDIAFIDSRLRTGDSGLAARDSQLATCDSGLKNPRARLTASSHAVPASHPPLASTPAVL
jgi:hypothetical protein